MAVALLQYTNLTSLSKTNFDFTHASFEVVQALITIFFCLLHHPLNSHDNLYDSMFTDHMPDLLCYINNLQEIVGLVSDMNIHFDNRLHLLTKLILTTIGLYNLIKVINKPTH